MLQEKYNVLFAVVLSVLILLLLLGFVFVPPVRSGPSIPFYSITSAKSVYAPGEKIRVMVTFVDGPVPVSSVDVSIPASFVFDGVTRQDSRLGQVTVQKLADGSRARFLFTNPTTEAKFFEFSGSFPTCSKRVVFRLRGIIHTGSVSKLPLFILTPGPVPCQEYRVIFPVVLK
jgi:hypothetical protein